MHLTHFMTFLKKSMVKYINQNIMDHLFLSAEEQQNLSSFLSLTPTKKMEDCTSADLQFSPRNSLKDSELQMHEDWSIIDYLPIQSKIKEPLEKVTKTLKQQLRIKSQLSQFQSFNPENSSFPPSSSMSSNSQYNEKTTNEVQQQEISAQIYEEIQAQEIQSNISAASLKNFVALLENTYHPHVSHLKLFFNKTKKFCQQSLQTIKEYISFIEIKMKQQIESLKALDEIQSMLESSQTQNQKDNQDKTFGIVFVKLFNNDNSTKKARLNKFYKKIKEIYEQLLSFYDKISQRRRKKQKFIEQKILNIIDILQKQIEDMIKCRLLNQKQKNEFEHSSQKIINRYLQLKYLIQREKKYLQLIADLNGKIISYMISIFQKEELLIGNQMHRFMSLYTKCYVQCYQECQANMNKVLQEIEKYNSQHEFEQKNQLAQILIDFIPKEINQKFQRIYKLNEKYDKLEIFLNQFSQYLQSTIFVPVIQMNNDYILYRNQVIWITNRSILQKQEQNLDYEQKFKTDKKKRQSQLSQIRYSYPRKIMVVLTLDHYLHLEKQNKVATIDLNQIKIVKHNRQIIIIGQSKGYSLLFGSNPQIGKLQFQNSQEVELFVQKIHHARRKKDSIITRQTV